MTVTHAWWWLQFLHPGRLTPAGPHQPNGGSYWFWSGIGSGGPWLLLLSLPILYWRHHNCHVRRCPFTGQIDPETHHPACKRHHSHRHKLGTPAADGQASS